MRRSYWKLRHMLIGRNMTKGDLRKKAGIMMDALAQLGGDESMPLATFEKSCDVLDYTLNDILEYLPEDINKNERGGKHEVWCWVLRRKNVVAVIDLIDGYPNVDSAYITFYMMNLTQQGNQMGTAIIQRCERLIEVDWRSSSSTGNG